HVSYEHACSGSGIPHLYDYLQHAGAAAASPEVAARVAAAEDRTPLILQAALDSEQPCPLCAATLQMFVSILGAEAGNLALKALAPGGVYLGGGIPPRILPALAEGRFCEAFQRKGRLAELLARVPIHVITNNVALIGAASYGLRLVRQGLTPGGCPTRGGRIRFPAGPGARGRPRRAALGGRARPTPASGEECELGPPPPPPAAI